MRLTNLSRCLNGFSYEKNVFHIFQNLCLYNISIIIILIDPVSHAYGLMIITRHCGLCSDKINVVQ